MLSTKGQDVYNNIVPLVLEYKNNILSILDEKERASLANILKKLTGYIKE